MEFDMNKMVNVKNRSSGIVVYRIPGHSIRRKFNVGEVHQVPYQELVWLSFEPGGRNLMMNMLQIQEATVTEKLNIPTEPEYNMSEEDIVKMLLEGSVDELKDALDFAPTGVIEIIKDKAVKLPIYDTRKRDAIYEMTGFNVTSAIANSAPDEDEASTEAEAPKRRVQRETESRYKVVE